MSHIWMSHAINHEWVVPHLNESLCHALSMSHVTRTNESSRHTLSTSHVTHMNESCHTSRMSCATSEWVIVSRAYRWVMSHMWTRHATHHEWVVPHLNESSCHTLSMGHVTHMKKPCHTSQINCATSEWVIMSHIINESCHTFERVMPHIKNELCHIWMSHCVTHTDESCHTYERVMPHITNELCHIWMSHYVKHMDKSRHTYRWVMPHIVNECGMTHC